MGEVYEARHLDLGKRVAIKTLLPAMAQRADVRERFLREGTAAARIDHPHAVTVTDVFLHDETPCLVMEYLDGEDLGQRIDRVGAMPLDEVARTMLPVFAAVAAAHREGIVHRDLKPPNIFLHRTRDGVIQPKVLDFGISKMTGGAPLTGSASLLGTPQYMSPEQVQSTKHVDARADQYALGVILYECATGRTPFEGEALLALVTAIVMGKFPRPTAIRADLPEPFEALILRAMAPEASDRFPDVTALATALLPFADEFTRRTWEPVFRDGAIERADAPPPRVPLAPTLAAAHDSLSSSAPSRASSVPPALAARPSGTLEGAAVPIPPAKRRAPLGMLGAVAGAALVLVGLIAWRAATPAVTVPPPRSAAVPARAPAASVVVAPPPSAPVVVAPPPSAPVVVAPPPTAPVVVAPVAAPDAGAPRSRHHRHRPREREGGTNAMPIL